MQKQRERMEARRKRLAEAAKKAAAAKTKKPVPAKVNGIGPEKDGATYARKVNNSKTKPSGVGPVKSGAAYARSLTKGKSTPTTKADRANPKPSSKVPQRFADGGKGGKYDEAVQNKEKAKSNFFRSGSGTHGKPLPSNPKLKSQSKKNLTGRQKIALEVASASGGKSSAKRSSSRKPANPKKGQTYVTRTGMTMVWTGENWKQKRK